MKKLIIILLIILTSCATYTSDGIYMNRYSVNDSIPNQRIRIKYYPVYIQRYSPYYDYYYRPYWNTPYYHIPRNRPYTPSYSGSSNRGSVSPRTTPSSPSPSGSSTSPSSPSSGKSKGGVIQ